MKLADFAALRPGDCVAATFDHPSRGQWTEIGPLHGYRYTPKGKHPPYLGLRAFGGKCVRDHEGGIGPRVVDLELIAAAAHPNDWPETSVTCPETGEVTTVRIPDRSAFEIPGWQFLEGA